MVNVTGGGNAIATPRELKAFLGQQGNDTARLLGKKDAIGNIQLYTSNKRASLFQRVTGQAAKRRANAREAVNQVMGHHERKASARGMGSQGSRALFGNVKARLAAGDKHALRSGDVKSAFQTTKAVVGMLPKATGAPALPTGPQLAETGLTERDFKELLDELKSPQTDETFVAHAERFGDKIAAGFGAGRSRTERQDFSLSDGAALREQIKTEIKKHLPTASEGSMSRLATLAFNRAATSLSPDRAGQNHTVKAKGKDVDVPELTIGGKTFVPERHLGDGGFARVFLCRANDGSGETVAVKLANEPEVGEDENIADIRAGITREMGEEAKIHRAAVGTGHDNIIGLKGTARLPDGRLAVALETAPHGDVMKIGDDIKQAIGTGPGKISAEQADILRFVILNDMAQGLKKLGDQNVLHLDFKAPNCLVGEDGTVKIADFGLSRSGPETGAAVIVEKNNNPLYKSPEMARADNDLKLIERKYNPEGNIMTQNRSNIVANLSGVQSKDIDVLSENIMNANINNEKEQITLTEKSDVFGLGIAAFGLFSNDEWLPQKWNAEKEAALSAFLGSNNVALSGDANTPKQAGSLGTSTPNTDANELINRLMDPVPANRPTMAELADSNAFYGLNGDVGDKAHALIVAIARGDGTAIDTASRALQSLL